MIKLPNTGFKAFVNFSNKLVFSKLKKKKPRSCKVTIIPGENPNCTCKFFQTVVCHVFTYLLWQKTTKSTGVLG